MIEPKEIIRSKRKTIALVVDKDGELIVRAPKWIDKQQIMGFVEEKQEWIAQKSIEMKQRAMNCRDINMVDGDEILYMGKACYIRRAAVNKVLFDGETFVVPDTENAKDMLILWYKRRAKEVMWEYVTSYAEQMQVEPKGIRITTAKTRWGSCSYDHHLNFSWRLLMCPENVISYVVVHELCHFYHRDHSKDFWASVEQVDGSYKDHELWLRNHERLMEVV